MALTDNKLRVINTNNTSENSALANCGNESLIINTGGGLYLGNSSTTPTLIADNGENKYLKITGGELTGEVKVKNTGIVFDGDNETRNIIRIAQGLSDSLDSISNYGFTLKFTGGNYPSLQLHTDYKTNTLQRLVTSWNQDGAMYTRDIFPITLGGNDLGDSSSRWNAVYAISVYADSFEGTATSAKKLTVNAGTAYKPVYFSNGVPVIVSKIDEKLLAKPIPQTDENIYGLTRVENARSYLHNANRMQFANPAGIIVEYSTDGGTTWIDYGLTDSQKIALVSGIGVYCLAGKGLSAKATPNDKLRITINASAAHFYTLATSLLINFSSNYSTRCRVDVERAYRGSETSFTTWKTNLTVAGWSGWNSLVLGDIAFGGSANQTTNIGAIRLTFYSDGVSSSVTSGGHFCILDLELLGDTYWIFPHQMAKTGHIYSWDASANAIFSKNVTASNFIGKFDGSTSDWYETIWEYI